MNLESRVSAGMAVPENAGAPGFEADGDRISACMDGELASEQREKLLTELKSAGQLQGQWSLYHCIGDVLRSDELACQRIGFQARFAARLEKEPHVFAPRAAAGTARAGARRWLKPASLAASVAAMVVVAGVLMQQRGGDTQTAAVTPAAQMMIPTATQPAVMIVPSAYLAAHHEYASGLAMQGMVAHIRTVAHDSGE